VLDTWSKRDSIVQYAKAIMGMVKNGRIEQNAYQIRRGNGGEPEGTPDLTLPEPTTVDGSPVPPWVLGIAMAVHDAAQTHDFAGLQATMLTPYFVTDGLSRTPDFTVAVWKKAGYRQQLAALATAVTTAPTRRGNDYHYQLDNVEAVIRYDPKTGRAYWASFVTRSPGPPPIADGTYYGYITHTNVPATTVTFNRVEYYTGARAGQECLKDGIKPPWESQYCNGYYIRDNSPVLRTVHIDPDAAITTWSFRGGPNRDTLSWPQLVDLLTRKDERVTTPFRLEIRGGRIENLYGIFIA
jgi:hypothetical protein